MHLRLKIIFIGSENVGHKGLRVHVNQWEPGTLNLYLNFMSFFKSVIHILKLYIDVSDLIRYKGFRVNKTISEFAPHDFASDHQVVVAHF